jgi:glycogen phosphorylase
MIKSTLPAPYAHPYAYDAAFKKSVAYFSMEFAIDQSLKTYSGGLGFLAGSHVRSAHDLKQNMVGIGMLWKYGYYDQDRKKDNSLDVQFREKMYHFLQDTGKRFQITIKNQAVWVGAYYLDPKVFGTIPMFFLTTDVDGNDEWARTITYRLYDADPTLKVAQCMVLGIGGAKFLDELNYTPDVYHFNEAHALSAAFYLYKKWGNVEILRKHVVFTTHTPEEAGNEKHDIHFLDTLCFFAGCSMSEVRDITGINDDVFNHSLAALRLCYNANGVSKLHGEVSRQMWGNYADVAKITHVTNAQHKGYWADKDLEAARVAEDVEALTTRKKQLKQTLFDVVADQAGKIFDPNVLTIVWARRFAGYKRPDLLARHRERFDRLMTNTKYPVQFIWGGKPYPFDQGAIDTFNELYYLSHLYPNMAVVTGHELSLSKKLKCGSDIWLNNPVVTREASGTSGMTAAMNASINLSTYDGWVCEFAKHGHNSFVVPVAAEAFKDVEDIHNLYNVLENEILPLYYERPDQWQQLLLRSMTEVGQFFDSNRMAAEYYERVY